VDQQFESDVMHDLMADSPTVSADEEYLGSNIWGKYLGSYMVRPVLQEKFDRNIKKYCTHISGLCMRLSNPSGPDGIRASRPYQSIGLNGP
jgi:hypothetical protein